MLSQEVIRFVPICCKVKGRRLYYHNKGGGRFDIDRFFCTSCEIVIGNTFVNRLGLEDHFIPNCCKIKARRLHYRNESGRRNTINQFYCIECEEVF